MINILIKSLEIISFKILLVLIFKNSLIMPISLPNIVFILFTSFNYYNKI